MLKHAQGLLKKMLHMYAKVCWYLRVVCCHRQRLLPILQVTTAIPLLLRIISALFGSSCNAYLVCACICDTTALDSLHHLDSCSSMLRCCLSANCRAYCIARRRCRAHDAGCFPGECTARLWVSCTGTTVTRFKARTVLTCNTRCWQLLIKLYMRQWLPECLPETPLAATL